MNFDSPGGGKVRRKSTAEPTMTMHTRAATDEIYSIFNQPLKAEADDMDGSSDFDEDDCASVGESTVTGQLSAASSDFDDDTTFHRDVDEEGFDDNTQAESVVDGDWTAFTDTKPDSEPSINSQAFSSADPETTQDLDGDETDSSGDGPVKPRFIPQMPDDYNPPYGPYRDPAIMAQNRLPFMTPIVERTESSFPSMTAGRSNLYSAKTPSKPMPGIAGTPSRSPMGDLLSSPGLDSMTPGGDRLANLPEDVTLSPTAMKVRSSPHMSLLSPTRKQKPVIEDAQCNPTDKGIRRFILDSLSSPLTSFRGYYTHPEEESQYAPGIQKYMKMLTKRPKSGDEASFTTPILEFNKAERSYIIRRELGAGAYAPVYLAESVDNLDTYSSDSESEHADRDSRDSHSTDGRKGGRSSRDRHGFEAVKMELGPPNPWEFYMIRTAYERLQNSREFSRAVDSIIRAHELHVFRKESFLVEDYRGQGTLLDLINIIRNEPTLVHNNGEGGLDECLAMFFTIELFRTVEALHANDVLHGDIKPDNCLVRFEDPTTGYPATSSLLDLGNGDESTADPYEVHYSPRGHYGWRDKGLSLIDFGRSIDMRVFQPSVQFIADWEPSSHECNEIREMRPWTHQIDLYGVAGTVHVMLFGKYIESVPVRRSEGAVGAGENLSTMRTYRIRETLKRYWEREIWGDVFDLLLNPGAERWVSMEDPVQRHGEPGSPVFPVLNSMRFVREKMETWLLNNAERKGLSLQVRKLEAVFAEKRRKLLRS